MQVILGGLGDLLWPLVRPTIDNYAAIGWLNSDDYPTNVYNETVIKESVRGIYGRD